MTDTGLELGPKSLDSSIGEFAKENSEYYAVEFSKIQGTSGFPWSWNTMAAVLGPLWAAIRGVWGFYWAPTNWRDTNACSSISQSVSSRPPT